MVAAAAPCTNRAAINSPWFCANPQTADEIVKADSPLTNTFFGPTRSPNRPAKSRNPPKVMRYALITQASEAWEKCSSR